MKPFAQSLLAAFACLATSASPALAASASANAKAAISPQARTHLKLAFAAARDFRPRGDRYNYQIGRQDAETAMHRADATATSDSERLLANDIHAYFVARDACRLAATVSDYGTCEARIADSLADKIIATLNTDAEHEERANQLSAEVALREVSAPLH